ncbi:MAG: hypothetical protein NTU83_03880 [Candidatus Hydrogenedentes bacterium]|nr:hypothetical protein [Candidatus Hydrogenedentota bacterium]
MRKMSRVPLIGVAVLAFAMSLVFGCWAPAPPPQTPPPVQASPPPTSVAPAPVPAPQAVAAPAAPTPAAAPPVPAPAPAAPTPAAAPPVPAPAPAVPAEPAATTAAPAPVAAEPSASTAAPVGPQTKEEALAMWQDLAKTASAEKPNLAEGINVAKKLAEFGQDALQPVYDTLADKASSPRAKALAAISLSGVLDKDSATRLLPLVKPENDLTTRVCATKLLTTLLGANVDDVLNQLKSDPEHQVRFQALRALATRVPEGRKDLIDFWSKPDTTIAEKKDILTLLASVPSGDSLPVFLDVLRAPDFDEGLKLAVLSALTILADASTEPILTELAEKGASDAIKTAAKDALDAVNGRKKATAAAQANAPKVPPNPAGQ